MRKFTIHFGLFLITFICTTLAGSEWTFGKHILAGDYTWHDFYSGMPYSISFLLILTVHEFGHYFTALYHRVKTTLPYYIPFYFPFLAFSLGTMGAVIRLKSRPTSTVQQFDIGIAGPLAGFVVALVIAVIAFTQLPSLDYLFAIHPEYQPYGQDYAEHVYKNYTEPVVEVSIGKNVLFWLLEKYVADPALMPHANEWMHYPLLFATFLSLVFTSINLLPIGQLDGGHVTYGLFGFSGHRKVALVVYTLFLFYAGLGYLSPYEPWTDLIWEVPLNVLFYFLCFSRAGLAMQTQWMFSVLILLAQFVLLFIFPDVQGYSGWLLFVFIIGRFVGIEHPPSSIEVRLDAKRKILGWIALLIFILSFSPRPIDIQIIEPKPVMENGVST